jgi:head-tail adaptor
MHVLNEIHKIGHLDREIQIWSVSENRTDTGSVERTPVSLGTFWAKMEFAMGTSSGSKEADTSGKLTEMQMQSFIIRYNAAVTPKHYITYSDQTYDIKGINEEGRQRFMRLIVQRRL